MSKTRVSMFLVCVYIQYVVCQQVLLSICDHFGVYDGVCRSLRADEVHRLMPAPLSDRDSPVGTVAMLRSKCTAGCDQGRIASYRYFPGSRSYRYANGGIGRVGLRSIAYITRVAAGEAFSWRGGLFRSCAFFVSANPIDTICRKMPLTDTTYCYTKGSHHLCYPVT